MRSAVVRAVAKTAFLEFWRSPAAVFWTYGFPLIMAFVLGFAFQPAKLPPVPVAVVDSPAARSYAAQLERSERLAVELLDAAAADAALARGRVALLLQVADGAPVLRSDPTRPEAELARLLVERAMIDATVAADSIRPVAHEDETRPGARYIDFLIPGLIGLNLMGSGLWGIGFSVVIARTNKLLKRLAATPMRRGDYLLSIALSRLLFLGLEVAAIAGAGRLLFGVEVAGSIAALALVSLLGALSFGGIGLLVAARPRTVEAVSGWMNLVQLPMWLLSGTFFSYERFPEFALPFIRALPLTALNDALRGVMNDGLGLGALWAPVLILVAWGLTGFAVAVRIFRWQ